MYYLFGHTVHSHPILAIIGTALVHHNRDRHDSSPPHTSPEHGKSLAFAVGAATGSSRLVRMEPPPPPATSHSHTHHGTAGVGSHGQNSSGGTGANWRTTLLIATVLSLRGLQWAMQATPGEDADAGGGASAGTGTGAASGRTTRGGYNNNEYNMPPPPPAPLSLSGPGRSSVPPAGKGKCPLCLDNQQTPCVSTGGCVYCYRCLVNRLREDEENNTDPVCPVTGLPCRERDIILIH